MENHDRRGPMFLVEVKDNLFSNYLYEYLRERCQDLRLKISSQEAFQILTTSSKKSFLQKEREDLVKVAMIKEREQQKKAFARHFKKYEWLEYGLQGKILKKDYFQERLKAIKKGVAKKLLIQMQKEKIKLLKKQQKFLKELKIHQTHRHLFKIARDSIYGKNFSKDAQFYSYYAAEKLFKEVGRRSNLTLEQLKFLTFPEYKEILLKGKDYAIRANERMKYSIHFANKGKTIFFHGKDAKKIRKKLHFIKEGGRITKQNELKGNPAYPGKVIGKVKIINTVQEMMKMHRSDVLVSHMTNPDIVPVMKQASAIITDLGGITCHAAIISRELKIPCIIGTKIATQMLKDGDKVEVDANKGIVKKL
ncbi:hypothetical protein KKF32_01865 [Patescibacteria group bacterium]|nr:hypothetical protein [Patescibacteria group bacterium]